MASTPTDSASAVKYKPRVSARNLTMATVLVGPDKTPFVVQQELLTYYSPFFRAALTGGFEEAEKKLVKLEDVDDQLFEYVVHWVYYQRLPGQFKQDDEELLKSWEAPRDGGVQKTDDLIDLYLFADQYQFPNLKRDALDELFVHINSDEDILMPSRDKLARVFDRLSETAPLCRYLIDLYARWDHAEIYELVPARERPLPFVDGLVRRHAYTARKIRHGELEPDYALDPCDYHEHPTEDDRKACKEASKADK